MTWHDVRSALYLFAYLAVFFGGTALLTAILDGTVGGIVKSWLRRRGGDR